MFPMARSAPAIRSSRYLKKDPKPNSSALLETARWLMMSPTMNKDTVSGRGFRRSNRSGQRASKSGVRERSGKRCAAAETATTQQKAMLSKRFTLAMNYSLVPTMALYFS